MSYQSVPSEVDTEPTWKMPSNGDKLKHKENVEHVEISVALSPVSPVVLKGPFLPLPPFRFIKLVGLPAPDTALTSEQDLAPYVPNPAMKDMKGGKNNDLEIVDMLDAQNEDPFTLEPLEGLIILHAQQGKDFILARVTTVDPVDENRYYYSYYAAHHINKVLFRTQPEEGLLHRMKARNPLNNMTIVGDVFYYVIKANAINLEALKTLDEPEVTSPKSPLRRSIDLLISSVVSQSGFRSQLRKGSRFLRDRHKTTSFLVEDAGLASNLKHMLGFESFNQSRRSLRLIMKPEALYGSEVESSVTDRRSSLDSLPTFVPPRQGEGHARQSLDIPKIYSSRPGIAVDMKMEVFSDDEVPFSPTRASTKKRATHTRKESTDIVINSEDGPGERSRGRNALRLSVDGDRGRVRSASWSNETHGDIALSEWVRDHSSRPFCENPELSVIVDEELQKSSSASSSLELLHEYPPKTANKSLKLYTGQQEYYYEAYFHSTDDDFLMKSSVRTFFRENAMEAADAVLFTIPNSSDSSVDLENAEQHPALADFVFALDGENASPARQRRRRILKVLLALYVVGGVLIVTYAGLYHSYFSLTWALANSFYCQSC